MKEKTQFFAQKGQKLAECSDFSLFAIRRNFRHGFNTKLKLVSSTPGGIPMNASLMDL